MLSRVASSLYWLGRYIERGKFTAQLVEATIRLDMLSVRSAGEAAWSSALAVVTADRAFAATGQEVTQANVLKYLLMDTGNPASVRSCFEAARENARAVRTALSRDAWQAINKAWMLVQKRPRPGDVQATINLIDSVTAEARGFEGSLHRMLRNEAYWLIRLGQMMERGDSTARVIDVKYHLLLPEGEDVGGRLDRDQWTTILHTVSAVTAYRWLYRGGLKPSCVAEMLILRPELPRSILAAAEDVATALTAMGRFTGQQGEADRIARSRLMKLRNQSIDAIILAGLHEFLADYIAQNGALDRAIARQFRFS
jgi:uncharacterized alpha-E superfamily protein